MVQTPSQNPLDWQPVTVAGAKAQIMGGPTALETTTPMAIAKLTLREALMDNQASVDEAAILHDWVLLANSAHLEALWAGFFASGNNVRYASGSN